MSGERASEERAAEAVLLELERVAGSADTAVTAPDDEVAEVLRRLYLETLGLLGATALPVEPPPELRARLLAGLTGDETQEVEPLAPPVPVPAPPRQAPAPPPPEPLAREIPLRGAAARRPRGRRRLWAATAFLGLAAAALAVWAAYLQSELDATAACLQRAEAHAESAARAHREELAAARGETAESGRRLALVTAPGAAVFSLRPPPGARQPSARATLFVAPDRKRWLLEARNLAPEPPAQDYQLWFVVDGIPLRGEVFEVRPGQTPRLTGEDLPPRTAAVWITLERQGGAPAPSAPMLLAAESSIRL